MRVLIVSLSRKLLFAVFAAALSMGLMPVAAFADVDEGRSISEGSLTEGGRTAGSDAIGAASVADASIPAPEGFSTERVVRADENSGLETPMNEVVINKEMPLDSVVAQAETTKSFFLAQALESTHTVPMVSAKLPIDDGSGDDGVSESDGEDGAKAGGGVSSESTVVGSFQHEGMTFAIEADGESVALVAVDYSKLPEEHVSKQVIAIPEVVSPDGIDSYSVTRIANGAFAGLTEEGANPDYVGCKALFEDEALLAEAGIDPEEVAQYLNDEGAASAAQDGDDASASSDVPGKAEAFAYEKEPGSKPSAEESASAGFESADHGDEPGSEPSVEEGESADPDGADDVRTIVSMDGDVATLDDGTTYEFKNPLAGKKGILALSIPASVSKIEDDAFSGFITLQYLVVSDDDPEYASYDGALYSADLANLRLIPEGRVGAVRVASSATNVDPEVFSHCPSVDVLVADAESGIRDAIERCDLCDDEGEVAARLGVLADGNRSIQESLALDVISAVVSFERDIVSGSTSDLLDVADTLSIGARAVTGTHIFGNGGLITVRYRIGNAGNFFTCVSGVDNTPIRWNQGGTVYPHTIQYWSTVTLDGTNIASSLFSVEFHRTGYSLTRFLRQGSIVPPSGTDNCALEGGHDYIAQWTPNIYTVSFDANGGAGGQSAQVVATYDAAMPAISAVAPTREGYRFGGWYDTTGASAGTQYYTADGASARTWNKAANTTLYARWIADLSWTNEGRNGTSDKAKFPDSVFNVSGDDLACSVAAPEPGYRKGYDFAGWAVYEVDGTTLRDDNGGMFYQVGSTIPVKGSSSIQAQWNVVTHTSKPAAGIYAVGENEVVYDWIHVGFGTTSDDMMAFKAGNETAVLSRQGNYLPICSTDNGHKLPSPCIWADGKNKAFFVQNSMTPVTQSAVTASSMFTLRNTPIPTSANRLAYIGGVYNCAYYGTTGPHINPSWKADSVDTSSVVILGSAPFAVLYSGPGRLLRFWQYGGEEAEVAISDDPGKIFVGWFDKAQTSTDPYAEGSYFCGGIGGVTGEALSKVPALSASKSLYAHYMPDGHDVVFDANGGNHPEGTGVDTPVIWVKHGSVLPENLKTGETVNSPADPYAKPYDHTSQTYEEAANASSKRLADIACTSRMGYRFDGYWTTRNVESGSEVIDGRTVEAKQYYGSDMRPIGTWSENDLATTTLYAHWTPITYKMSFDLAFGDGSASWKDGEAPDASAYDAIVYDTPVTFPKAPVRAGWIFDSWVRIDEPSDESYAAQETVDPANFASEQDAIASFEAHWTRNLKATVSVGQGTAELSVTADWDANELMIEEGSSCLVNLTDAAIEVVSIEEDRSDASALAARKANAREAFSARVSDPAALDAMLQGVRLLVQPVRDGAKTGDIASFPLFGSYALKDGDWTIPASSDPVNGTDESTLELSFGMDIDEDKISALDLKINLQHKTISSLIYTIALVDKTEPVYSAGA